MTNIFPWLSKIEKGRGIIRDPVPFDYTLHEISEFWEVWKEILLNILYTLSEQKILIEISPTWSRTHL